MLKRCSWAEGNLLMQKYHDEEWGNPIHDDRLLFELLILEGAQAGLSWLTVLKRREEYRKVFFDFDPIKVSTMTKRDINRLMKNQGIIRNRAKIESTITNAKAFIEIQKEFGSFDAYVWKFVDNKPILNKHRKTPSSTPISDKLSKDLKKRGFKFVGSTICYAFMQASGLVNDHHPQCFKCSKGL